jgi:hypothetical protein
MNDYSKNCTCYGSNENCCYCFGTGMRQGKLSLTGKALLAPVRKKPTQNFQQSKTSSEIQGAARNSGQFGSVKSAETIANGFDVLSAVLH